MALVAVVVVVGSARPGLVHEYYQQAMPGLLVGGIAPPLAAYWRHVLPHGRRTGAAGCGVVLRGVSIPFVVFLLLVLKRLKTPENRENSHFCTLNSHRRWLGSGMGTLAVCGEHGGCDAAFRTLI